MDRNKEFLKNTIIIFVGKFSTQFMSLLLIPLFTHYLSAEQYGTVDLLQTYIALFIPVLSLRMDGAVFRFLIDNRNNEKGKSKILTNTLAVLLTSIISTVLISLVLYQFFTLQYFIYVIINLIVLFSSSVFLQILRGLGKNKEYSIISIIVGTTTLLLNTILILTPKKGVESILLSSTIANLICIIYVIIKVNIFKYFNLINLSKNKIKELLHYSLPMIPDYLSGWIINVSDRTIIAIILGTALNGIYTVSSKFSNILNSIFEIFNMSWQETASLHINDVDRNDFFSEVINKMTVFFSSIGILMLTILPMIYSYIIGSGYMESYKYIPILLYANTWRVLVGLMSGIYIAMKKTKEVANTTIVSAVINLILNLVLIKFIGLYAACISTLLSYMIMAIYRYIDCKKYVNIKINIKSIILFSILFCISSILYFINNIWLNLINISLILVYVFIANKTIINEGMTIIKKRVVSNNIN